MGKAKTSKDRETESHIVGVGALSLGSSKHELPGSLLACVPDASLVYFVSLWPVGRTPVEAGGVLFPAVSNQQGFLLLLASYSFCPSGFENKTCLWGIGKTKNKQTET